MSTLPIVLVTAIFGIVGFVLLTRFVTHGAHIYEEQYLSRVAAGFKESFYLVNSKTLFVGNLLAMAIAGVVVFFLLGIIPAIVVIVVIALLPNIAMRLLRKRRSYLFVQQLPDALSAMASALRAGTSLTRVLEQVATQHPAPLSQEFSIALSEYRLGRDLEDSLEDVYRRVRKSEVELLNSAVTISRSVGGNLADTFDTLSETIREKLRVEGKIDALTSMGRMQGWVVCLLPFFVGFAIYKQEPEAMGALVFEPVGWLVFGVLVALMVIAIYLIRRIVNIEV